jgi:hypothetical protein
MGFFDSIKKATGLGLTANEHYQRAFEKAILLGPSKFAEGVALFNAAAIKAREAGDATTEARARANANLYGYITSGKVEYLTALRDALAQVEEIEVIGSAQETMPTGPLLAEVNARLAELEVEAVSENARAARAQAHTAAAAAFRQFFTAPLLTYKYRNSDGHIETAQSRFFLHQGLAAWQLAQLHADSNPEGAAEQMSKALNAFQQCPDADWTARATVWREKCRRKRTCYMCHREFQGEDLHFESYTAQVSPYAAAVVAALGQDESTLDVSAGTVVLCTPCGSAVRRVADAYATRRTKELRNEVNGQIKELVGAIEVLNTNVGRLADRLASVERVSHRH